MLFSGAWGKMFHEKYLKQKISLRCPFTVNVCESGVEYWQLKSMSIFSKKKKWEMSSIKGTAACSILPTIEIKDQYFLHCGPISTEIILFRGLAYSPYTQRDNFIGSLSSWFFFTMSRCLSGVNCVFVLGTDVVSF